MASDPASGAPVGPAQRSGRAPGEGAQDGEPGAPDKPGYWKSHAWHFVRLALVVVPVVLFFACTDVLEVHVDDLPGKPASAGDPTKLPSGLWAVASRSDGLITGARALLVLLGFFVVWSVLLLVWEGRPLRKVGGAEADDIETLGTANETNESVALLLRKQLDESEKARDGLQDLVAELSAKVEQLEAGDEDDADRLPRG